MDQQVGSDENGGSVATYVPVETPAERLANLLAATGGNPTEEQLASIGSSRAGAEAHKSALMQQMEEMRQSPTIEVSGEDGSTRTYKMPALKWSARRQSHVWTVDPVREHARLERLLSPQLATRRRDERRTPRPRPRAAHTRSSRGPPAEDGETEPPPQRRLLLDTFRRATCWLPATVRAALFLSLPSRIRAPFWAELRERQGWSR